MCFRAAERPCPQADPGWQGRQYVANLLAIRVTLPDAYRLIAIVDLGPALDNEGIARRPFHLRADLDDFVAISVRYEAPAAARVGIGQYPVRAR